MNEHIQKFAELAGFNLHNDLMDGHSFHHEIEKFSSLIVRECAEVAELYKNSSSTSKNALTISSAIKNKFGIYD